MKATSASNKKTTVLPMTKGACKYVNPSGTPKNATAMVRITRLTRTATMIVSGPTQTSLRSAKPFREVGRVVVDAISFSFQTSQTFTAFVPPLTSDLVHCLGEECTYDLICLVTRITMTTSFG